MPPGRARRIVLLALCLLGGAAAAQTAGTGPAPGLPREAGVWAELPNTKLSAVLPPRLPSLGYGHTDAIVGAWNSPAFDAKRRRIVFVAAGGHADYQGNEVYSFDLATLAWSRLRDPSPPEAMVPFRARASDGKVISQAQWCQENSHPCSANKDGTPVSVHTYAAPLYLPEQDVIYLTGGSRWYDGVGISASWWLTDLDATPPTWVGKARGPTGWLGIQTAWDPDTKRVIVRGYNRYWTYDPATDTYTVRSRQDGGTGEGTSMVLDAAGRKVYRIGSFPGRFRWRRPGEPTTWANRIPEGVPRVAMFDLTAAAAGGDSYPGTSGDWDVELDDSPGCQWDPVAKLIACFGTRKNRETWKATGPALFTLDLATRVWKAHEPPAGSPLPPMISQGNTWNRFVLSGDHAFFIHGTSKNVWAVKLPWRGVP